MMNRGTAEKRFRAVYQTHTRNNLPPLSSDSRNTNDSISFDFFFPTWVKRKNPDSSAAQRGISRGVKTLALALSLLK